MNYKDQIKDLAMKVNTALTEYVAVHNTIFQETATLNSLLRNVAGKGVTMSDLLEHSERLVPVWDDIEETMAAFRYVATPHWSNDEKRYFDILSRYASALRKTVDALVDRQRLMYEGSKGGRNNAMTWEAYQEKEKAYQLRIQEYTAIGQELNAAAPIVFDEEIESTISLNAQCASAFLIVAQTVMDDAHWRAFGFKRRPRRGKMSQGFVSASRLERETTLLRELWASSFSAIFR